MGSEPYNFTYTGNCKVIDDGSDNWRVKFLTSGTFTPNISTNIDVFLVGGGGGGKGGYASYENWSGNRGAGGAGGGGRGSDGGKTNGSKGTANTGGGVGGGSYAGGIWYCCN